MRTTTYLLAATQSLAVCAVLVGAVAERASAAQARPGATPDRYDVVVVGAGTGGVAAAMQAARLGASVLLLEATDWIGGQMSAAGVTSMDEGYPPRDHLRERGVYGEFWRRTSAFYKAIGKSNDTCAVSEDHFAVEPNVAQRILYQMIADTRLTPLAGGSHATLDVLLRADVTGLVRDGHTVTGVEFELHAKGETTRRTVSSQVVIDATEYGDLIPMAGAAYRVGTLLSTRDALDELADHPVQPITWTAVIKQYPGGVPTDLQVNTPPPGYDPAPISPIVSLEGDGSSRHPWNWERMLKYRGMPDSTSPFSAHNGSGRSLTRTHVNLACNDQPFQVGDIEDPQSRAGAEARALQRTLAVLYYARHVMGVIDWSVANDVGYDSPYNRERVDALVKRRPDLAPYREVLRHFPVMPYVRESRRIVGADTLTATQLRRKKPFAPVHFPTAVAIGDYPVDVHGEGRDRGRQVELDLDEQIDLPERWIQWGYGPFQAPFEAFIPERVDGFMPAEKNLSQSRLASGATRLQPVTMLTGQAAGAIAAIAVQRGVQPRDVPPIVVQNELLNAGSTLSLRRHEDVPHGVELWKAIQLASLYEVYEVEDDRFRETAKVSEEAARIAFGRLEEAGLAASPEGAHNDVLRARTRGALVRAVARAITTSSSNGRSAAQAVQTSDAKAATHPTRLTQ
ncbi:putative FAD-binding dehydrogenase [Pirellulimonas nuda]|uniref:Putative FAD-binding dehydrogenase n=1 Tax=Pirellulimonas nuda TaxID=2528009 RepID=A0A518DDL5_9BACT|nr:FAD-dependent oxidoreductase [Pirellulimonas nuda]QDU89569.1 putative FAD-binding dehydrogenase [Pirellulimonas nuda]